MLCDVMAFFSWKIHVGLWEKFVGLKITVKYPQIHWKIPADTLEKIPVYLPRYLVSQRLFDGKFVET